MKPWETKFQRSLLNATTFNEVVASFCYKRGTGPSSNNPRRLSDAQLSSRLGLRSRSHFREIAEAKKAASQGFVLKFSRAVGAGPLWTQYFELLNEGPEGKRNLEAVKKRLMKVLARKELLGPSDTAASLLADPNIPIVFASLGDESGASIEEVSRRSKMTDTEIKKHLQTLVASELVKERGSRFYAVNQHLVLDKLGSEKYFIKDFLRALDRPKAALQDSESSSKLIFFNSTFCVPSSKLPQMKKDFDEVLKHYIDASEVAAGDLIVSLGAFVVPSK